MAKNMFLLLWGHASQVILVPREKRSFLQEYVRMSHENTINTCHFPMQSVYSLLKIRDLHPVPQRYACLLAFFG